jgi:uncharacterized surface protein with fasciclin (FAS1) repeats
MDFSLRNLRFSYVEIFIKSYIQQLINYNMEKILKKLAVLIASSTLLFSVSNANAYHHGHSKSHQHICKQKTYHPHHKSYRHHGNRYAPRAGIADFIRQSPGLSALLGALTQADLTNTLSTTGPFTFFAPSMMLLLMH